MRLSYCVAGSDDCSRWILTWNITRLIWLSRVILNNELLTAENNKLLSRLYYYAEVAVNSYHHTTEFSAFPENKFKINNKISLGYI
jgi:hypothetical protein